MANPAGYNKYLRNLLSSNDRIRRAYETATFKVIQEILELETKKGPWGNTLQFTPDSQEIYDAVLREASLGLRRDVNKVTRKTVGDSITIINKPNDDFVIEVMGASGVFEVDILSSLNIHVNEYVRDIQFQKLYRFADGTVGGYSKSLWGVYKQYKSDINNVVYEGMIRGRDVFDIARDLEVYVKDGKKALMGNYLDMIAPQRPGETLVAYEKRIEKALRPGETLEDAKDRIGQFRRRIGTNVDYRAVRLARTITQGAVQDAQIAAAETNPAVYSFNWMLSPLHDEYSVCDDIIMYNPYTYETFDWSNPPHVNCQSHVEQNVYERNTFLDMIKTYESNPNDPSVEAIRVWDNRYYQQIKEGFDIQLPKLLDNNLRRVA